MKTEDLPTAPAIASSFSSLDWGEGSDEVCRVESGKPWTVRRISQQVEAIAYYLCSYNSAHYNTVFIRANPQLASLSRKRTVIIEQDFHWACRDHVGSSTCCTTLRYCSPGLFLKNFAVGCVRVGVVCAGVICLHTVGGGRPGRSWCESWCSCTYSWQATAPSGNRLDLFATYSHILSFPVIGLRQSTH